MRLGFGFGIKHKNYVNIVDSGGGGASAPTNLTPPSISGTPEFGQTLTATPGSWSGSPTPSISGKWQRGVADSWEDIDGATNSTYEVTLDDFYHDIRYIETAVNSEGNSNQASNELVVDDQESDTSPVFALHLHDGYGDTSQRLFTDLAKTTPAVNDGDKIMVVYDPVSGLQAQSLTSPADYRPTLRFDSRGIPYLERPVSGIIPFLYVPTRAWFTGKRGAFYFAFRSKETQVPLAMISTAPSPGVTQAFNIYNNPRTQNFAGGVAYAGKFDNGAPVTYAGHNDWQWECQSVVRNADTSVQTYNNGVQNNVGATTCANNQPSNANLYYGYASFGLIGSLVYSSSGTFDPILDRIVRARAPKIPNFGKMTIIDGDSLMASSSVDTNFVSLLDRLETLANDSDRVFKNVAIGGQTVENQANIAGTRVDAAWLESATQRTLIFGTCSNDSYFGGTPAENYDIISGYVADRLTADPSLSGNIIFVTATSRSNVGTPSGFNVDRHTLEGLLESSPITGLKVVYTSRNYLIGRDGAETDLTYFLNDLAHINGTGYQIWARDIDDVDNDRDVTITGVAMPGETLTSLVARQWYINTTAVSGQTGTTLTLTPEMIKPGDVVHQGSASSVIVGDYDTDAATDIASVLSAGSDWGTTDAQRNNNKWAYDTLIRSWKTNGVYQTNFYRVMAGPTSLAGALACGRGGTITNNNFVSGDYSQLTGLKGNASNKYLDSGVLSNTFAQNNVLCGAYITENAVSSGTSKFYWGDAGLVSGAIAFHKSNNQDRPNIQVQSASDYTTNTIVPFANIGKFTSGGRNNSAQGVYTSNGTQGVFARTSEAPLSATMKYFCRAAGALPTDARFSMIWFSAYYDALLINGPAETYMDSLI